MSSLFEEFYTVMSKYSRAQKSLEESKTRLSISLDELRNGTKESHAEQDCYEETVAWLQLHREVILDSLRPIAKSAAERAIVMIFEKHLVDDRYIEFRFSEDSGQLKMFGTFTDDGMNSQPAELCLPISTFSPIGQTKKSGLRI